MHHDGVQEMNAPIRGTIHSPRRSAILLLAVSAFVVLAVAFYAPSARWVTDSRGEHLVRTEVKDRIDFDVPEGASDIRYYQHSHPEIVIAADFAIKERDFAAWANRQGWTPKPIVGSITVWPRSGFGDRETLVTIKDGLDYNTIRRGTPNRLSVTYDRDTLRAYFTFCSDASDED